MASSESEIKSLSNKLKAIDFEGINNDLKRLGQLEQELQSRQAYNANEIDSYPTTATTAIEKSSSNSLIKAGGSNVSMWVLGITSAALLSTYIYYK